MHPYHPRNPYNLLSEKFVHIHKEAVESKKLSQPEFVEEAFALGVWLDDVFIISKEKLEPLLIKYELIKLKTPKEHSHNQKESFDHEAEPVVDNSVLRPIKNFANSMKNWVAGGMPMASEKVYSERKAICDSCPFWDKDGNMGMGKCNQCGCTSAKLFLATEKCPVGKWGPETKD